MSCFYPFLNTKSIFKCFLNIPNMGKSPEQMWCHLFHALQGDLEMPLSEKDGRLAGLAWPLIFQFRENHLVSIAVLCTWLGWSSEAEFSGWLLVFKFLFHSIWSFFLPWSSLPNPVVLSLHTRSFSRIRCLSKRLFSCVSQGN